MKFYDDLQKFTEENLLPDFESWTDAAEFLDVSFINGGAKDAVKNHLHPAPPAAALQPDNLSELLAKALNPHLKPTLDESAVIALIQQHSKPFTAKTEVYINDEKKGDIKGRQHSQFKHVLKVIAAGIAPFIYGPAGTGKTQLAQNAATALGKEFYLISVCAQSTKSDLLGYTDAGGNYVSSLFREAYEKGGVFLIDEIDNGNPNVLAVLNCATSNGYCPFPDKMVKKHDDFLLVATANTFGTGADRMYVGRNQLDAATLNRFVQIEINYDEELERELWPDIAERAQEIRRKLAGERVIVSMRNISHTAKLIAIGDTMEEALQTAIINTIPANLRNRI